MKSIFKKKKAIEAALTIDIVIVLTKPEPEIYAFMDNALANQKYKALRAEGKDAYLYFDIAYDMNKYMEDDEAKLAEQNREYQRFSDVINTVNKSRAKKPNFSDIGIDEMIRPLIFELNARGIETYYSCQGHPDRGGCPMVEMDYNQKLCDYLLRNEWKINLKQIEIDGKLIVDAAYVKDIASEEERRNIINAVHNKVKELFN